MPTKISIHEFERMVVEFERKVEVCISDPSPIPSNELFLGPDYAKPAKTCSG